MHCWLHGKRHVWGDWWWRVYRESEYRICQRCGLVKDRPFIARSLL